jgi:hypothetical protein
VHGDLTRREVESEWKYGFKNAKLVKDKNIARYISKYMTKRTGGKNYRASVRYGKAKENITENTLVTTAFKYFPSARIIRIDDVKVPYKYQHKLDKPEREHLQKQKALRRDGT